MGLFSLCWARVVLPEMLIPKKDRTLISKYLFDEGVLVAKKDFNSKHGHLPTRNLYVIKLLQSFKSKGFVNETFSWQWHYFYLNNEGIEYLREYLHLPETVVPRTLKPKKGTQRVSTGRPQDRFGGRRSGAPGAFKAGGDRWKRKETPE